MSNINICKTLDALIAGGFSVSFHTSRHPLFIQKRRIAEACELARHRAGFELNRSRTMKRIIVLDMKRKYPTLDKIVEDDANPYNVIVEHVVANGGKRYQAGKSMSAYFGRFYVEEKPVTE